jgi:hypothetical protein
MKRGVFVAGARIRLASGSARVLQFDEMTGSGSLPAPRRFGGLGNSRRNEDGFSDHFPIGVVLKE